MLIIGDTVTWSKESAPVAAKGILGSWLLGISDHFIMALSMETTPGVQVDQVWTKEICSSHPRSLLVKVKITVKGSEFHGIYSEIPGISSCVFVMRHILLTIGPLQAHSGEEEDAELIPASLLSFISKEGRKITVVCWL